MKKPQIDHIITTKPDFVVPIVMAIIMSILFSLLLWATYALLETTTMPPLVKVAILIICLGIMLSMLIRNQSMFTPIDMEVVEHRVRR